MRLSLDTNILVYSLHVEDHRNRRAVDIVGRAARSDCVQTVQSLGECFNVLVRKRGFPAEAARMEVERFRTALPCVASRPEDLGAAMHAVSEHRLSFWDAMLWATARRAGCTVILSEDLQDGRILDGVRFMDPFRPDNAQLVDLILPSGEP